VARTRGVNPAASSARWKWLVAYALTTFFAFPQILAGRVVDLGAGLAWLAPACLLLGLEGLAPRRAAWLAFLASLLAHSAVLHWFYVVTVEYGHASPLVGVFAPVGGAAYIAVFTALFGAGSAWLARRRAAGALALAALWVVSDHLRSFALSGFPWATLGYAQHQNPALMALASWTGVYGLSFVSVVGGAALAQLARARRRGRRPGAAVLAPLGLVAAIHGLGFLELRRAPLEGAASLRVAVLQGNIGQGVKWSPEWAERTLAIYEDLSRSAAERGARIIVWPETAVPGSLASDPELVARLAGLARETDASLVVGGVGVEWVDDSVRFFDSAFFFDPAGLLTDRYDKAHLVPFGEYVPLRALLARVATAIARGMASGDVQRGRGPRAVLLGNDPDPSVPVGVPICYDLLFPDLVRRFVAAGGGVLFAITNDAWYGRTGAPYQFLAITAMRSAENRVWTARAANTGVSAIIDDRGRVREQTGIFERDLLVADIPHRPPPIGGSFYTRHGDVFALGCWIAVAALALWVRRRRAAESEGNDAYE